MDSLARRRLPVAQCTVQAVSRGSHSQEFFTPVYHAQSTEKDAGVLRVCTLLFEIDRAAA